MLTTNNNKTTTTKDKKTMTDLFFNFNNGQLSLNTYRIAGTATTTVQDVESAYCYKREENLNASIFTLDELVDSLNTFDTDYSSIDLSSLPTWGEGPDDTCEIFSWNDTQYMLQDCNGDFYLEDR